MKALELAICEDELSRTLTCSWAVLAATIAIPVPIWPAPTTPKVEMLLASLVSIFNHKLQRHWGNTTTKIQEHAGFFLARVSRGSLAWLRALQGNPISAAYLPREASHENVCLEH
mmetsp:Transcript_28952/g.51753  ORF Transcript_28952/g.51753 Transcript_28952/m.51753 type:complete len:115 (+) Transcript_28952:2936-3280(+)